VCAIVALLAPASSRAEATPDPLSAVADWEPGQPIPVGYHEEQRRTRGAIIAGSVLLGVSYLGGVSFNVLAGGGYGAIPIAGPFVGVYVESKGSANASGFGGVPVSLLVVDGLAQVSGLAVLVAGLVPQRVLVTDCIVKARLTPTPLRFGKSGAGIAIAGTF
jgi:hypothetical protein